MPVINKGTALSNGEQLTAEKLNDLLDLATFSQTATDGVSTFVNSSGQIAVLDGGISATKLATNAVTTAKLATDAVTTAKIADSSVTKAKMENISAPLKVLGRTTAGAGVVEEVTINDDNAMSNASASTLATDASIKQYVDTAVGGENYTGGQSSTFSNGLIMKMGIINAGSNGTNLLFADAFPGGVVSASACPNNSVDLNAFTLSGKAAVNSLSLTGMVVSCDGSAYWQAIGY
jgi:hypothetical protein